MGYAPSQQFRPLGVPAGWGGTAAVQQESLLVRIAGWGVRFVMFGQFLYLTRRFYVANGFDVAEATTALAYGAVLMLIVAQFFYATATGTPFGYLNRRARSWYIALLLVLAGCALHGFLIREYDLTAVANDAGPWLLLIGCIVIGSIPVVWKQVDASMFWLFMAAVVINALGLREVERVITYADAREGVQTVAYKTQWALSFWPYLLLTARHRSWPKMLAIFGGVLFYFVEQVMFQKRAPMGRLLIYGLIFAFVLPRIARHWSSWNGLRERQMRQLGTVAIIAGLAAVLVVAPGLFLGQLTGLGKRLAGERYESGALGTVSENERFLEAGIMLRSLENHEIVLGRGFGGYYPITGGLELITHPGAWLTDVQTFGRRELHVGGLMPMLKGGLLLMFVYFSGLIYAIFGARRRLDGPINTAAFFIVIVSTLFLLQEGSFILPHGFDIILLGMSLGRLLSDPQAASPLAAPQMQRTP